MATIPKEVAENDLSAQLARAGLARSHQGKVRDTYPLAKSTNQLLVVASDRISIFDFVLPAVVPKKGEILTALTVFWLVGVLSHVANHLRAWGKNIRPYLPEAFPDNHDLQRRSLVVTNLDMVPVECIVRGYLTGSGWESYQKNQQVCGLALPAGLFDGSQLPQAIFTPTTKAQVGHDEHLQTADVNSQWGDWLGKQSQSVYNRIAKHAADHGIIVADTKFEWGESQILADEVGTPDSSRFWKMEDWRAAAQQRKSPTPYDKQVVRDWGKTIPTPFGVTGINKLKPENPDHVTFVQQLDVPVDILDQTSARYHEIFARLTGVSLVEFQHSSLGISV